MMRFVRCSLCGSATDPTALMQSSRFNTVTLHYKCQVSIQLALHDLTSGAVPYGAGFYQELTDFPKPESRLK